MYTHVIMKSNKFTPYYLLSSIFNTFLFEIINMIEELERLKVGDNFADISIYRRIWKQ